jgi:hypothetical protein
MIEDIECGKVLANKAGTLWLRRHRWSLLNHIFTSFPKQNNLSSNRLDISTLTALPYFLCQNAVMRLGFICLVLVYLGCFVWKIRSKCGCVFRKAPNQIKKIK